MTENRVLKANLADYKNRYKQISGKLREQRIEIRVMKERLQEAESIIDNLKALVEGAVSIQTLSYEQIKHELSIIEKRATLVQTISFEDIEGRY